MKRILLIVCISGTLLFGKSIYKHEVMKIKDTLNQPAEFYAKKMSEVYNSQTPMVFSKYGVTTTIHSVTSSGKTMIVLAKTSDIEILIKEKEEGSNFALGMCMDVVTRAFIEKVVIVKTIVSSNDMNKEIVFVGTKYTCKPLESLLMLR